jgi:hypothetical protein
VVVVVAVSGDNSDIGSATVAMMWTWGGLVDERFFYVTRDRQGDFFYT